MKFVKGISLFVIYPAVMLGIGIFAGVKLEHFFYPGEQKLPVREQLVEEPIVISSEEDQNSGWLEDSQTVSEDQKKEEEEVWHVSSSMETLSVDTEYVLEETDVINGTVVETTWKLPDKYIGMTREQFLEAMDTFESFPPLAEMERGFVDLEVLSFSRERVVVQMNYQYIQPSTSFYLAVMDNEVVVYLEDMKTVYINTGIELSSLPEDLQMEVMQMMWIEDEESLYDFLETYSS